MDADLEALEEQCSGPMEFGVDDCVPFCANLLLVQTGDDLMGPDRGRYSTAEERDALLAEHGLVRRVLARLRGRKGWRRVEPASATPPALGLAQTSGEWVCCVRLGNGWWATRSVFGVAVLGTADVRRAWQWG